MKMDKSGWKWIEADEKWMKMDDIELHAAPTMSLHPVHCSQQHKSKVVGFAGHCTDKAELQQKAHRSKEDAADPKTIQL